MFGLSKKTSIKINVLVLLDITNVVGISKTIVRRNIKIILQDIFLLFIYILKRLHINLK